MDNTFSSARKLNTLTNKKIAKGVVRKPRDKHDFFEFDLKSKSSFSLQSVRKLNARIRVKLFDSDRNRLGNIRFGQGRSRKKLTSQLEADTYFLQVTGSKTRTKYKLRLKASQLSTQPPTQPPQLFPPVLNGSTSLNINENQITVFNFDATDPEGDTEGNGLTYKLAGGADQGLFEINQTTGELRFKSAPDFENPADADKNNLYNVGVSVTDSNQLTDSRLINVSVKDVSETVEKPPVAPTLNSPTSIDINENQITVFNFDATDSDGDTEGNGLTYKLAGGADQGLFEINQTTGELRFKGAPDFENPADSNKDNQYDVRVSVTDSNQLSDSQSINVSVKNVDDQNQKMYLAENGEIIIEAESAQLQGDWELSSYEERTSVLYDGRNFFSEVPTGQSLEYFFKTDVAGDYHLALYTARDNTVMGTYRNDLGNDAYIRIEELNTGKTVLDDTKLFTGFGDRNGELQWGSTFDIRNQKSSSVIALEANTEYRFTISGRSDGYAIDRFILNEGAFLRNSNKSESQTRTIQI